MFTIVHKRSLAVLLLIIAALLPCCVSPCPDMSGARCRELVSLHEAAPGELAKAPVSLERRGGEEGLWIGGGEFRTIVWSDAVKGAKAPCGVVGDAAERGREKAMAIFKSIRLEGLERREGTINYEMSLLAFEKEMAQVMRRGRVMKSATADGRCRFLFQLEWRCLRRMVYEGDVSCR